ncbi:MAG TPA: hypothetical protein VJG90_00705 [Candidatus Nanoarchaeia archaeon]|nr:hypothetical protein [Candidatus Nanoarchaeia archaeon]
MISVEQLQRANTLSKELKNFGFADNSETAYSMAEQLCEGQGVRSGGEPKPAANPASSMMTEFDRTRVQVNKKLSDFSEQLNNISEKMEALNKALKLVEMNQISFDKRVSELIHQGSQRNAEIPRVATVVTPQASERKSLDKPIDRNGIAPADVKIENFFYAGKR